MENEMTNNPVSIDTKQLEAERKKQEIELIRLHKLQEVEEEKRIKEGIVPPNDSYVILSNVNKVYSNNVQAVFDFNLDIKKHEFIVFVGPSGCGKSTTLRMIAGLESITRGDLFIDGVYSNELTSKERDIAMVFQNYALYPHMTVYDNIAFGLRIRKVPRPILDENGNQVLGPDEAKIKKIETFIKARENKLNRLYQEGASFEEISNVNQEIDEYKKELEIVKKTAVPQYKYTLLTKEEIDQKVKKAADILQLTPYLNRRPREMSGGQRQRAALGRAISRDAKVFLMDEPLSNLDAKLRVSMRSEITRLHKQLNATTIYVTHDQTEAMTMADRIVVMKDGYIQQIDTPEVIYNKPANKFVATFMGAPSMNMVDATFTRKAILFNNGFKINVSTELLKEHDDFYRQEIANIKKDIENEVYKLPDGNLVLTAKKTKKTLKERLFGKKDDKFVPIKTPEEKLADLENKIATYEQYLKEDHPITFGIRPEDIYFNNEFDSTVKPSEKCTVRTDLVELLGAKYYIYVTGFSHTIIGEAKTNFKLESNKEIDFYLDLNKFHLFDDISTKSFH